MSDSFAIEQTGERCLITGVLDFTTASQALDNLGELVASNAQLQLDFSQVGRCNSAALALLIELRAIARQQGHQVSFTDVPDGIRQLAKVCQVDDFI
ncbi:STAS domain-containing protein [Granulosicoccus sp. 3-233]|uniref:STAS domain-containing protein n=1 Tax=Granulosicoccus sp. 3-233 TaxID=3417969 RepID=UPI003D33E5D4